MENLVFRVLKMDKTENSLWMDEYWIHWDDLSNNMQNFLDS